MIGDANCTSQEVIISEFLHLWHVAARHHGERQLLAWLAIHRTTLLRWRTGESRIPAAARALVQILASGRPPQMSELRWRGFQFQDDAIITPEGRRFTPQALGNLHWQDQFVESLQRRIARLEAQIAAVQAQRTDNGANDPIGRPGVLDGSALAPPARQRRR